MQQFVQKLHIFAFLWVAYSVFTRYEEHTEQLEMVKSQIPAIEDQITRANKRKDDIKNFMTDIEEAKKRIELVGAEIDKLQKQLPANISDADNLDLLSNLANTISLKNPFFTPGTEENKGFYITKRYFIKAQGTFLQFLIFLEKLSLQQRILNVHSFKMDKGQEKAKGRFQIINGEVEVESYRYNPDYKEERGIEAIQQQFKKDGA